MAVRRPTCFRAALASTASVDSGRVMAVGVAVVGVAAGERRGVEVKDTSSPAATTRQAGSKGTGQES